MNSDLATPRSIAGPTPDEVVAARFLSRYREPTRTGYATSLKGWFRWCRKMGIQPMLVERAHIELWARELEEVDGNKPATICGKLNAVCGMYKYAQRDRVLEHNASDPVTARHVVAGAVARFAMTVAVGIALLEGVRITALQ